MSTSMSRKVRSPLFDLKFRKAVDVAQVREAMDGDINPFTKQQYSGQYKHILEERKKLPVYAQLDKFLKLFSENQIVVVMGETGSGKTTQIPQFVVHSDLPHTNGKVVACTQPNQSPTQSIARRVASEMDVQLGRHVGYSIPFDNQTELGTTFLQYMTDEVLLQEAMHDPLLERYSTIIIDEIHERTVASDILVALLKSIAKQRTDFRIIVISGATLDAIEIQKYFSLRSSGLTAQLFEVPGRRYPVEVFYTQEPCPDYFQAAIRAVIMIHQTEDPGDILLFLTGEKEIEEACQKIKLEADDLVYQDTDSVGPLVCLPLYSSLPPQEQQRVFDPAPSPHTIGGLPGRKVVVSSNMAETFFTMDRIVYIVDPGFAMHRVYNPRVRVESYLVSPISKVSAHQRAHCAGHMRSGKCFRLYTEKDFRSKLEEQTVPKILSSSLSGLVLILLKIGVMDLVSFDFVDAPAPETLMRALELLNYLAALNDNGVLTAFGGLMAEFPIQLDPQLMKLLVVSSEFNCSTEIMTIVAMMVAGDIWLQPYNQTEEVNAAREMFTHPEGDHLTLLEVYNQYMLNQHDYSWAERNYLSGCALRKAGNIRTQLRQIMKRFNLDLTSSSNQLKQSFNIRQALVCGFFMQVAHKNEDGSYVTVKDNQLVYLHPSCGLDTKPEWVIFNEFILTTHPYIRTVSEVKGEWLFEFAANYFDLSTFPSGRTRNALQRAWKNKAEKAPMRGRRV